MSSLNRLMLQMFLLCGSVPGTTTMAVSSLTITAGRVQAELPLNIPTHTLSLQACKWCYLVVQPSADSLLPPSSCRLFVAVLLH